MKNSYVTYLSSDDYLLAILGLSENLRMLGAQYPLHVLVTSDVKKASIRALRLFGLKYSHVKKHLTLPDAYRPAKAHWDKCLDKLNILNLDYEKIVYLDSDIYITQNIDDLFSRPGFSAVEDGLLFCNCITPKCEHMHAGFGAGVIVLEPDVALFESIPEVIERMIRRKCFNEIDDQMILNELRPDWPGRIDLQLPLTYNVWENFVIPLIEKYNYRMENFKVIHFIFNKVFNFVDNPEKARLVMNCQITPQNYFVKKWFFLLTAASGKLSRLSSGITKQA